MQTRQEVYRTVGYVDYDALAAPPGMAIIIAMPNSDTFAPSMLTGASNFRSLSGLTAGDGRGIRQHVLMRSDRLCNLTPADWRTLAATGLKTICDLRSDTERLHHPNCPPPELRVHELCFDVRNDIRTDKSLIEQLAADPTSAGAVRVMVALYRRLPRHMALTLRELCDWLLRDSAPMLIHCTAGKDRTGFAVAMLLHALGIPRERIYEDYLVSRDWPGAKMHRPSLVRRLAPLIPVAAIDAIVDAILEAREGYLDAAFAAAGDLSGSVDRYLQQAAGFDSKRIAELRDRVLI